MVAEKEAERCGPNGGVKGQHEVLIMVGGSPWHDT